MGTISTVTGVKNVSVLCLKNTDLQINSTVNNMNLLEASNSHLITLGTVTVNTVRLNDSEKKAVKWDAFGATTIASSLKTDSFVNTDSFIATNRLAKTQTKPNFVLNGSASTAGTPFYFKVYASGVKSASVIANAEGIYRSAYEDQALLIAPKANADKFRAAAFRNDSDTSYADIISYKDLNYSVMNGKKSSMAVELTRYEGGTATSLTYAKSFAQAVTLIDAVNDTKSSYVMTLLNNSEVLVSNNGKTHVRTAQSSGKPIYGSLVLPTKAASVTVRGEAGSDLTIAYTGKLTPKCNITFENISLLEGSVNNKKNWTVSKEHAPNVDLGSGKYTLGLPGNEKVNGYSSLTAKSGTISLADAVTVSGAINVKNLTILKNAALKASGTLTVSGDTKVYSKAAITGNSTMTFGNIVPAENNAALSITTRRTAITKKSTVSKTQLTINGQVNADTSIQMMVYDTSVSGSYRPADAEDEDVFLLAEGAVPTDAAKVAVIPKASLEHISVLLNGETPLTWKYGKGLYLTDAAYLPISVSGYSGGTQVYEASFMTWAQAVAEIDSLNTSGRDYTIKLYESIGNNGSIGTLTMPTKAKSLTITSENDNVTDNGRAIFFTGTTITLKCPTEFSKIGLVSVKKKTGGKLTWYDSQSYKITAGSYNLKMTDMMRGGDYYYGSGESHEWLTASLSAITGNAKATFTYAQTNRRYQKNESTGYESWSSGTFQTAIAGQVTGFGTVSLKRSLDADGKPFDEKSYADVYISGGISGITTLNVDSNVNLIVKNGNVTTKNARIDGTVTARNFTSTGTLTMSKGCIDVSGYVKNTVTGAVKLNNLVLLSMDNQIFGRWNKSNQSQIVISGTISTSKGYDTVFSADLTEHVPLFVGLTYYTRAGYVQLYSGLLLLQSTKTSAAAANTLFAPWYSTNTTQGMGQKPQTDGAYLYKLVKSGKSNLIYQRTAK
jgi:hypothetical protein